MQNLIGYDGYTDQKATSSRIYRNLFNDGDAVSQLYRNQKNSDWQFFATGDWMRSDAHGNIYFCDRKGDTYR